MFHPWRRSVSPSELRKVNRKRQPRRAERNHFVPYLERLESRNCPSTILNVSKMFDNQSDATIAINPANTQQIFVASTSYHGGYDGATYNAGGSIQRPPFTNGLFFAYSSNGGTSWTTGIMATGISEPANAREPGYGLPAAGHFPRAAFDQYGNLFLAYVADYGQYAGSGNYDSSTGILTDTNANWVTNEWANPNFADGSPGNNNSHNTILIGNLHPTKIKSNTNDTLTVGTNLGHSGPYSYQIVTALSPSYWRNSIVVVESSDGGTFSSQSNFTLLTTLVGFPNNPPDALLLPLVATGPGFNGNALAGLSTGSNTNSPTATLNDTNQNWPTNRFANELVTITAGTGAGQTRTIASNTATQLTVTSAWSTIPDNTSSFEIAPLTGQSTSNSNTSTTLIDANQNWSTNQVATELVRIISGTGAGQTRSIASNTATQLTVTSAWSTTPDATSTYEVAPVSGTSTSGDTATTLNDTNQSWTSNFYAGDIVVPSDEGTGAQQATVITSNTSTQLTVSPAWGVVPDPTSGTSTGSNSSTTLNDTHQNWSTNQFTNELVRIIGGTGAGQTRTVSSNTGTQLTVTSGWSTIPDATSTYEVAPVSYLLGPKFGSVWVGYENLSTSGVFEPFAVGAATFGPGLGGQYVRGPVTSFYQPITTPNTENDHATLSGLAVGPGGQVLTSWVTQMTDSSQRASVNTALAGGLVALQYTGSTTAAKTYMSGGGTLSNYGSIPALGQGTAPALSQTSGGTMLATTYYVQVAYVFGGPAGPASRESNFTVSANNLLQVNSPASVSGATGYNVYAATASLNEVLQNTSPVALGTTWTEPTTGLVTGTATPTQAAINVDAAPQVAYDTDPNSSHYGRAYLVYTNSAGKTGTSGANMTDIFEKYSTDNGTTWSNPLMVNTSSDSGTVTSATSTTLTDTSKNWTGNQWAGHSVYIVAGTDVGDSAVIASNTSNTLTLTSTWLVTPDTTSKYVIGDGKSHFWPQAAVDPKTGKLAVSWYDARNDPGNVLVQLYDAISSDGGVTFSANNQITAGQTNSTIAYLESAGTITSDSSLSMTDSNQVWTTSKTNVSPPPSFPPMDWWQGGPNGPFTVLGANIADNSSTALTLVSPGWSPPPVGTTYTINPYDTEGVGRYTGLAFYNGQLWPAWADNSNSTGDNPNRNKPNSNANDWQLNIYTVGLTVSAPSSPSRAAALVSGPAGSQPLTSRPEEAARDILLASIVQPTDAPATSTPSATADPAPRVAEQARINAVQPLFGSLKPDDHPLRVLRSKSASPGGSNFAELSIWETGIALDL